MKFTACVALASLLAGGASSTAHAADPADPLAASPKASPTPKERYDRATILYNIQDWPGAIEELKAAYEGDPRPEYLYTLAQAERLSGDCASAILTYRAFIREASGIAAVSAEGFIHVCEAKLKQEGAATQKVRQAEAATAASTRAPAEPAAPVHPAPASPATWYEDPLADTLAGLSVVGIATGTAFLLLYGSNVSATKTATTDKASQSDWSTANSQVVVGGVVGGVSVVALGVAIWRWTAVGSRSRAQASLPSVGFSAAPNGFQLSYGSRF